MYKNTGDVINFIYDNGGYVVYRPNFPRNINPKDIKSLSLPYERVVEELTEKGLEAKINSEGWKNNFWRDIRLYKLPDCSLHVIEGNHRTVYSNKYNLKSITANIEYLIPLKELPKNLRNRINKIENHISILSKKYFDSRYIKSSKKWQKKTINRIKNLEEKLEKLTKYAAVSFGYTRKEKK